MSSDPNIEPVQEARSKRINLSLASLYLDPNNFRFIDHQDYSMVPDDALTDEDIQRRTRALIVGSNAELVQDLIASFTQNGWLDVEPIHVKRLADRKYLVVEGNRRVATLKHMQARWLGSSGQLGRLGPAVFSAVPCIHYEETDAVHQLVMMGLHHISGKKRWPAINQARLMKRLRDAHDQDPDQVCRSLGVSKREFNLSLRTLALTEAYRRSDYGDQFVSEKFNLFREVLKAPALRAWLRWDPDAERCLDTANQERLFSWLSREPEPETEGEEQDEVNGVAGEPAITSGVQVRELARIIEDPDAVKRLEETRSLQSASLSSDLLVKNEIQGALERCNQDVSRLFNLAHRMSATELDRIDAVTARLQAVAIARKREPPSKRTGRAWQTYTEVPQAHFGRVQLEAYRGLSGVEYSDLARVNLLVGINNAGKTSTLEALYLLAHQSDPRAIIEVIRRRTRVEPEENPTWMVEQLPHTAKMTATFDQRQDNVVSLSVKVMDEPDDDEEDYASYLRSLEIKTAFAGREQRSMTDFFEGRVRRTLIEGEPRWLCPAVLHSPFSLSDRETLTRCNEASIRSKSKDRVLDFIRDHLDPGIEDIALADKHDRFLVTHSALPEAVDLSVFGEGLQRVFQVGLLFAGVRGGVVLIDEFENALHTSVLIPFTRFVQQLAMEFDNQVFLTTHSKETVDAFLFNDYRTEDLVAFLLRRDEGEAIQIRRFAGPDLRRAVEVGDVDLRRL
ncbi:MAG: AAA family ATPase [Pseudomonadota bacterium]